MVSLISGFVFFFFFKQNIAAGCILKVWFLFHVNKQLYSSNYSTVLKIFLMKAIKAFYVFLSIVATSLWKPYQFNILQIGEACTSVSVFCQSCLDMLYAWFQVKRNLTLHVESFLSWFRCFLYKITLPCLLMRYKNKLS